MKVCLFTDMEGLAGVDDWEQCYALDDADPAYAYGLTQLAADTNATIAGCFDAGATEVVVWDLHGRNGQKAFSRVSLDPRASIRRLIPGAPWQLDGLDRDTAGVLMVGQHAMAGTVGGFIDHTMTPKEICRYTLNGADAGEMSMFVLHAAHFGVPLLHVSGDEALCAEANRLFPWVATTPTKRGTGWATCELYPVAEVRARIRRDVAAALGRRPAARLWTLPDPVEVGIEYAWSGLADDMARNPGVRRTHARAVAWHLPDARYVFNWPGPQWQPPAGP